MKKSLQTLIISLLLILSLPMTKLSAQVSTWDGTWEPWTHGTGTEAVPFLIENAQQLAYLAYRVNNGLDAGGGHVSNHDYHYKLMVDVDLNGSEEFQWTPIGYWNSDSDYQCFGGHFDGNDHTISNLYVNSSANRVGLFSYSNDATIENTHIDIGLINGSNHAGGIIGMAEGTSIKNCSNKCTISSSGTSGGIVGAARTTNIYNCHNHGDVVSNYNYNSNGETGGIIGYIDGLTNIINCYNTGNITSNQYYSGGIVGCNYNVSMSIINCYNTGDIVVNGSGGGYKSIGGIIGRIWWYYTTNIITNCYNTGITTMGGIIGEGSATVSNCYYLNTCGGNNSCGGEPKTDVFMKSLEFVDILNNGSCSWTQDIQPFENQGYPILTGIVNTTITLDATDVTQSHATLHGTIEVENTSIQSLGFEYKKTTDSEYQIATVSGNGDISKTLSNLTPNTQYQFRTFCTPTDCGTTYGELKTFTTQQISVNTNNASEITQSHATLNGNLNTGDADISSQGFQYKKTTDSEYQTVTVSGNGDISTTLSNLTPNTQYRFRTFCTPQGCETVYGQEKTFNTLTINVTTYPASNITESSATLNGHIDVGDANVTDKGFIYWPLTEPQNVNTVSVSTTGNISATINNLAQDAYQYRAFAASNGDTYLGEFQTFTISWLNNDTIYINNAEMLRWVADQCNNGATFENKCVVLTNDIELPLNVPNNMVSIGSYPSHPFKGTFDGNGKHIYNLYIDQPNTPYQGFFGYTLNANLFNVGLVNITASGRNYTGGMVAYAKNTHMRDCYVNGGTLFALSYCGGLVGYQEQGTNSIISGCYNTCEVTGNNYVGGLIGFSNYSTVRNSYVAGRVAAQGEPVGAIIGGANEVLMYYCYFSIELTGQTVAIGENNFKDGEGLTNEQMRDPQFVNTLNQNLVTPVWKADYASPINNGFPIIMWQQQNFTGINEDNTETYHLSLYPNPANDFVTIQSDDPNVSLKCVEVYDITGRKVMSESLDGQSQNVSISKLPAGIYQVRVQIDNGRYNNLKLVVQ